MRIEKVKIPSQENFRSIVNLVLGLASRTQTIEEGMIKFYDANTVYQRGDVCFYDIDGHRVAMFMAKTICQGVTPVLGGSAYWGEISDTELEFMTADEVDTMMNTVAPEVWDYLSNVISTEISATHCWSSSKTFQQIQDLDTELRDYILQKIAESGSGAYREATSTDEVVSDKYLYLIPNASNYDIYALVENVPKKLTTTDIDLTDYLKKEEAELIYAKKTDIDGTYATVTALDNHTSNAVAHLTQVERDNLLTVSNITTTLDGVNVDDKVPSAKAVNDIVNNVLIDVVDDREYLTLSASGLVALVGSAATLEEMCQALLSHYSPQQTVLVNSWLNTTNFPNIWNQLNDELLYSTRLYGNLQIEKMTNICYITFKNYYNNETWTGVYTDLNDVGYSGLSRVTRTKAADVASSPITLEAGTADAAKYMVKNGICYVTIWGFNSTTILADAIICSTLPAPAMGIAYPCPNTKDGSFFFIGENSPILKCHYFTANQRSFNHFSYPVAE